MQPVKASEAIELVRAYYTDSIVRTIKYFEKLINLLIFSLKRS